MSSPAYAYLRYNTVSALPPRGVANVTSGVKPLRLLCGDIYICLEFIIMLERDHYPAAVI